MSRENFCVEQLNRAVSQSLQQLSIARSIMRQWIVVVLSVLFAVTAWGQYQGSYPGSGNYPGNYQQYRGRLSPGDQSRYDSYYQRWLNYKATNDRDQISSMERRMQE